MFEKLKDHRIIAWDVDGVLFNHEYSLDIHNFIVENPYDQIHHIVTFRSHGMEKNIFRDLARWYKDESKLTVGHFSSVESMPNALYESQFKFVGGLLLPNAGGIDKFQSWKGEISKSLGATVLIDDETSNVLPGCIKHSICHIHPNELTLG